MKNGTRKSTKKNKLHIDFDEIDTICNMYKSKKNLRSLLMLINTI